MSSCKILIVEDDPHFANNLRLHLQQHGYEVVAILSSAEAALEQFSILAPELVLMDIVLEGELDGIEGAQLIRERYNIPVLYLTVYSDDNFTSRAKVTEPYAYILKPFNERELLLTIEMALYRHRIEQQLVTSLEHLEIAQRVGNMGSWEWNITENSLHWSKEIYRIFGTEEHAFNATYEAFLAAVHPDDRQMVTDSVNAALNERRPYSIDHRIVLPDGTIKSVHEQAEVEYDAEGRATFMTGTVQDVTQAKQVEEKLRLFATIFENTSEGIVITGSDNRVVSVNDAYCRLTGYRQEEIVGRNPSLMQSGHHDKAFYRAMWETIQKQGQWQGEIWDRRKSGEVYPKWLSITAIKNPKGDTTHHIGIFTDISELKRKEEHLHQLAYFDTLTGLANRSQFNKRLGQEVAAAKRNEQLLAVLYIDLDRFKQVNDYYGHGVGDELLRLAAERMLACVRETDILARMGGDEFTAILTAIGSPDSAAHVADKIINDLSRPFLIEGHEIEIGASVGISLYPRDGDLSDSVVMNADRAMYQAKESGGGGYFFSNEELTRQVERRLFLDNSLREALEKEQFTLYYQPQFDLAQHKLIGMEALIRWNHPEEGLISPVEFIPRAEATQLIIPLGEWVLKTACRQNREWQVADLPAIPVAVNFSAAQFRQRSVIDVINRALRESGLAADYLDIEITESLAMEHPETTIHILEQLQHLGAHASIDDFGTGYSSLSHLKQLPVSKLKIDRAFIMDITTDPDDRIIAKTIIDLARNMEIKVIAEGTETAEQVELLKQLGCDYAQGYYFAKPLPAGEMQALLEAHRARP